VGKVAHCALDKIFERASFQLKSPSEKRTVSLKCELLQLCRDDVHALPMVKNTTHDGAWKATCGVIAPYAPTARHRHARLARWLCDMPDSSCETASYVNPPCVPALSRGR
jgi:hypothetical protein